MSRANALLVLALVLPVSTWDEDGGAWRGCGADESRIDSTGASVQGPTYESGAGASGSRWCSGERDGSETFAGASWSSVRASVYVWRTDDRLDARVSAGPARVEAGGFPALAPDLPWGRMLP